MQDLDKEASYQSLLEARRVLDEFGNNCEIAEDIQLFNDKWLIVMKLKNNGNVTGDFPLITSWHVMIDIDYPMGEITFYPSKKEGIKSIYPQQSPHIEEENQYYYNSNICLEQYSPFLRNESYDIFKLYNYVSQALEWIKAASTNSLLRNGDLFEMVAYPTNSLQKQILFSEDKEKFLNWQDIQGKAGFCNFKSGSIQAGQHTSLFYLTDFYVGKSSYKNEKKIVSSYEWGDYVLKEKTEEKKGIWIKLKMMPLVEPWEAPRTWGQLISILKANDINFYQDVFSLLNELRDGLNHFMMLGFPIPKIVGESPAEYFWQGIELPKLSYARTDDKYFVGFRKNSVGYNYVDKRYVFNFNKYIKWIKSENWSTENLISRGGLSKDINQLNYLFIGVGSVGSGIVEAMVRMGVRKVDIVDPDVLQMGNLTRHELLANDLHHSKAKQMVDRISKSNIHYTGKSYNTHIEDFVQNFPEKISEYDVIIETTGENKVLELLGNLNLDAKVFSVSIGISAHRLYLYSSKSKSISIDTFLSTIHPWIDIDFDEFPLESFPRDGFGCWHPLFPARLDHVNLLCSTAVIIMETDLIDDKDHITIVERGELGTTKIIFRNEIV